MGFNQGECENAVGKNSLFGDRDSVFRSFTDFSTARYPEKTLDNLIKNPELFGKNGFVEQAFLEFISRDRWPCDYERQLIKTKSHMVLDILDSLCVIPYELEIQPSSSCNLACAHCFGIAYNNARLPDRLDALAMKKLVERVGEFELEGYRIENVKFCGTTGEPLMNPACLDGIKMFKDAGRNVILFTNGVLLNKKTGSSQMHYADYAALADKVNISLDAGTRETFLNLKKRDLFSEVIEGTKKVVNSRARQKCRSNVVISYVIGLMNYPDVPRAAELARDIGVDEIRYRVDFLNVGKLRERSEEIVGLIKQAKTYELPGFKVDSVYSDEEIKENDSPFLSKGKQCFNHHFWASIGPDGGLYACGHRTHSGVESYGNVLEKPLMELFFSSKRLREVNKLPDSYCKVCSPSSERRNCFMNFLANHVGADRLFELCTKYHDQIEGSEAIAKA